MPPEYARERALHVATHPLAGPPLPQPATLAEWEAALRAGRGPGAGNCVGETRHGAPTVAYTAAGIAWYAGPLDFLNDATPLGTLTWAEVAAATWRGAAPPAQLALF